MIDKNTKESRNKIDNLTQRLAKVEKEAQRLELLEKELLETPDKQISMTDTDARIMATRGRSSVMVGYTTYLPRSKTSNNRAAGLYDRSEFIYNAEKDEYVCPANQVLSRRHSSVEQGKKNEHLLRV